MATNEGTAKAMLVQTKYTDELMQKPHVMGVAVGMGEQGENAGKAVLVVMVDQKTPDIQIPAQLDGVPVEVREIGVPRAQ